MNPFDVPQHILLRIQSQVKCPIMSDDQSHIHFNRTPIVQHNIKRKWRICENNTRNVIFRKTCRGIHILISPLSIYFEMKYCEIMWIRTSVQNTTYGSWSKCEISYEHWKHIIKLCHRCGTNCSWLSYKTLRFLINNHESLILEISY
jgi:hypothetical protein